MTVKDFFRKLTGKSPKENNPVRLEKLPKPTKKKKRKYNYTTILIILSAMILLIICVFFVYQHGALESTQYYYRLH